MKKIAFLCITLYIISSQIFADENLEKFEKIDFSCQLNDYQENNQKINFININPIFFNDYFLLNIYKNISFNTNYQINRSRLMHYQSDVRRENKQIISQNDDIDELTTILLIPLYWFIGNPRPGPEIQMYESYEFLRRQREAENINRGISPYPSRILYQ